MNTRYVLFLSLLTASAAAQPQGQTSAASNAEKAGHEGVPPITPNRTLPKVKPPKTGLEFSANPTTQEISCVRVFEEQLVPIGGEPDADENAALAAAVQGDSPARNLDFYRTKPQSAFDSLIRSDPIL